MTSELNHAFTIAKLQIVADNEVRALKEIEKINTRVSELTKPIIQEVIRTYTTRQLARMGIYEARARARARKEKKKELRKLRKEFLNDLILSICRQHSL